MKNDVSDKDLLALFETGHEVLKAEKLLKQAAVSLRLLPAPAGLATGCTLAIRFEAIDRDIFLKTLAREGLQPKSIYRKIEDGWLVA